MPFVELPTGVRLHYVEQGKAGRPVVIVLHGMLGTAEMHMQQIIDWLRDDYHVLGPTLRGYGQSEPALRKFPHNFYQQDARDVLAFMDALAVDQAHLIGYSDGGEIALLTGGTAPERFLSIVTIGAVGYYGPEMRPVAQRMYPAHWITQQEREMHGIENPDAFVLPWIRSVVAIIDSGGDLSLSLAQDIAAPLLMLLGEKDTLNPQAYGQRFIDRTPNGRLIMFPCGHGVHNECWDDFKRVVGEFLAVVGESPPGS